MVSSLLLGLCILSALTVKPLALAFRDGDIAVRAHAISGHSLAFVEIENHRDKEVVLDVNGSYLVPKAPEYQRLGLGLTQAGSGDTSVRVAARTRSKLNVLCVCMDSPKSSPPTGAAFSLAKDLAPKETLRILEQWKTNPHIPQEEIQSAVWAPRPTTVPTPAPHKLYISGEIAEILAFDSNLAVVTRDGDFFLGPPETKLEFLPGKVSSLWAASDLYSIRTSLTKGTTVVRRIALSRLDWETRTWVDLSSQAREGTLKWVSSDGCLGLDPGVRSLSCQTFGLHSTRRGCSPCGGFGQWENLLDTPEFSGRHLRERFEAVLLDSALPQPCSNLQYRQQ